MGRQRNPNVPEDGYISKEQFENTGSIAASDFAVVADYDNSKKITFDPTAQAANSNVVFTTGASSGTVVITLPTTSGTLSTTSGSGLNQLTGDVTAGPGTGSQAATVALVAGSTAANVHSAELLANAATNANTASTIVKRDGSGNFTAGTIAANLTGNASGTAANVTGVVVVANGGTGLSTLTANNVILGNGTSTPSFVAPGTSGNVLTSNGTTWSSSTPASSGANTALSNLASVAISTPLLPSVDNVVDMGSATKRFKFGYFMQMVDAIGDGQIDLTNRTLVGNGGISVLAWNSGSAVTTNVIPSGNNNKDLGTSSFNWRAAYIQLLKDSSSTTSIDVQNRQLNSTDGTTPVANWTTGILNITGNTNAVVATQFDKTTSTTLSDITGLTTGTLVAAGKYRFKAVLHTTNDTTGGDKYAIAGTATATNIIYQIYTLSNDAGTNLTYSRKSALGQSSGSVGSASNYTVIEGVIQVNVAGTLTAQFAQTAATGTSSILVGSTFEVVRMS